MKQTLFILFVLTIGIGSGCNSTVVDPEVVESQKAASDEVILAVVLNDFLHRKIELFPDLNPEQTLIVLDSSTLGPASMYLSADQIDSDMRHTGDTVSSDMIADLGTRNTDRISLKDDSYEPSIVLANLSDFTPRETYGYWSELEAEYPKAKAFVNLWMPGYNTTQTRAIVRFTFGPTAHGATATYVLSKKNDLWVIDIQTQSFYL